MDGRIDNSELRVCKRGREACAGGLGSNPPMAYIEVDGDNGFIEFGNPATDLVKIKRLP